MTRSILAAVLLPLPVKLPDSLGLQAQMPRTGRICKVPVQVGEVGEDSFSVYLIPETLRVTVLGQRRIGDAVNIEIDSQTQVRDAIWPVLMGPLPPSRCQPL